MSWWRRLWLALTIALALQANFAYGDVWDASCGGVAPEVTRCEDTFVSVSSTITIGFTVEEFNGVLIMSLTSPTAVRESTCVFAVPLVFCLDSGKGNFVEGETVRLEGEVKGSGTWEVMARAAPRA